jgi:alkylation response protein AidB-like acyl-CoA dehydrogenase
MPTDTDRRGGAWLLETSEPDDCFCREAFSDEHRLIRGTAEAFLRQEVLPALDALERKDWALARTLLRRCGDLGLLGTDAPEALGGVGLDKVSSMIVGEEMGGCASFATAYGAQSGLALVPLLYFGTDEQQQRYVPRLVSGELVGAYALSESGSGSDALGARARATRTADGDYSLTGEKMWITNGGFADLFVVFAKVDGEAFTAFLVERDFPGVSTGNEEHKLGLHGSSTTPLILQEARVPAANVLGEIGRGHKVAFNVLNFGRLKLGAMCSGGARYVIAEAARYAAQRQQFGQPIARFGAIRWKLADMAVREFAVESMLFRAAGSIDAAIADDNSPARALAVLEEFAIEASILKVAGSETLDAVIDENVQIHGGNGFVRDYPAERHYRDSRVNRIFEGTNEINRLLIPGMLVRRALKGGLPLTEAAKRLQDELLQPVLEPATDDAFEAAGRTVAGIKQAALIVLGTALQRFGSALSDEQEILSLTADILIDAYAGESCLLRARRVAAGDPDSLHATVALINVHDAAGRVETAARQALEAMADGDDLRVLLSALRRILKPPPLNPVAARRRVADAVLGRSGYPFAD